jgi:hypothetical protein
MRRLRVRPLTGRGATADTADAAAQDPVTEQTVPPGTAAEQQGASCGGMSFSAGTKVLTAGGALVAISTLRRGEKVKATSTRTGTTTDETVTAVLVHHDSDLYDLKVRAGTRTAVIGTTRTHLFWDQDSHRWVKAAALKYGTHLRTPAQDANATVTGGYTPRDATGRMWDLTIQGDHDFYIQAATTTILAHNCDEDLQDGGSSETPDVITGQVAYGSTDLSRAMRNERIMTRDTGGNYAAGRLEDGTILVGRSSAQMHAEESVIEQAGGRRIVDIYSEREPCDAKCFYLTQDMNVTWSWQWNPPEVRPASNAALRAAVRELFP